MASHDPSSLFERLGGEPKLRAIISDFIDRVFRDPLIGFFFAKADQDRIKAKEYEFAAKHLGADVAYTGEPLPQAHARHAIQGGHFQRRVQLLRETLAEHAVAEEIVEHWIAHTERMKAAITQRTVPIEQDAPGARRLPLAFAAMALPDPNATQVSKRRELPTFTVPVKKERS